MLTLPWQQLGDVEEHILICPECQDRLQEMDLFVEAIREGLRQEAGGNRHFRAGSTGAGN